MNQESLPPEDEEVTIRFIGGGPWDGHEMKKEFTPKAFAFHKNVHGKCVTREYIHCGVLNAISKRSDQIHLYKLHLPEGEADEDLRD